MSAATREPRSGELRRRIVLEAASRTADGGGGASLAWTAVATLWASVRALSGEERVAAGRLSGRLSHEIVIRRRAGVTPDLRFRVGSRRLAIRAVLERDAGGRYLTCLCEEPDL
ncbi:MAG: phage head closure protein [Hyphomicrobiaceae bacterium]